MTLKRPPSVLDYPKDHIIIPPVIEERVELPVGEWLERGFAMLSLKRFELAIHSFEKAIGTNSLNDAGRCLSYWSIADAWYNLNDIDNAAEAYFSFLQVAQDIIDERDVRKYAVDANGDFVEYFDLKTKMAVVKDFLNTIWAIRNGHGRSGDDPIKVNDKDQFINLLINSCELMCFADTLYFNTIPVMLRVSIRDTAGKVETFFILLLGEN